MEYLVGLLLVTLAGIGTGAGAWPFKCAKDIRLEVYLFVWGFLALVAIPWTVTFLCVPDVAAVAKAAGGRTLLISNLLSCSWGIANVLYMVCVIKIGAALTGAILGAVAMAFGMFIPLVVKGSGEFSKAPDLFSMAGLLILVSLGVIVVGIILITAAGIGREKALSGVGEEERKNRASGSFVEGLLLVTLAGILSTGLSLSFVYSEEMIKGAVKAQNAGLVAVSCAPWAFAVGGGALVQLLFASFQLTRKKMWGLFFARKTEVVFGTLSGVQFFLSLICLGRGMLLLGVLGASIGYGIQQSIQTVANQVVGFIGGEWKGVYGRPRRTMYAAVAVILIAVALLSASKWFTENKTTDAPNLPAVAAPESVTEPVSAPSPEPGA